MEIFIITASVLLLTIIAGLLYLAWCGLFASITVYERDAGPFVLVFKKHTGDYKNIGPILDEVYYTLRDKHNLDASRGFGLFYDNPQEVEKSDLRSLGGCIVDGLGLDELVRQYPEVKATFGVALFPASHSVVAEHPYRGKASVILGVFRVYPRLQQWMKKYRRPSVPVMEIYDTPGRTITYLAAFDVPDSTYEKLLDEAV